MRDDMTATIMIRSLLDDPDSATAQIDWSEIDWDEFFTRLEKFITFLFELFG